MAAFESKHYVPEAYLGLGAMRIVVGLILMSTLAPASTSDFVKLGKSRVLYVDQMLSFGNAETFCKNRDSQLIEFWSDTEWREVKHQLLMLCNFSNFIPHIHTYSSRNG